MLEQDLLLHNVLDPQAAEASKQDMQCLLEITRLMCEKGSFLRNDLMDSYFT